MRILFAPGIFPPDAGGPATFVPDISTEFDRRGHETLVVTNGDPAPSVDEEFPFDVVRVRPDPALTRYPRQLRTVVGTARSFDPDVIFANAFDWPAVVAGTLTRTPVVVKVVGDMAWERAKVRYDVTDDIEAFARRRYGPRVELHRAVRTAQTRGADHVAVPSHYLKNLVAGWGVDADDITTIYNAIDTGAITETATGESSDIVTVCRQVEWKGVRGLIDAVAAVADSVPDATLHVIGDGPHQQRFERYAARTVDADRVVFHGRVPHDDVLEHVADSRVFALNSTYEGLPHAVLEAMACGTPAVVSDAGGNPSGRRRGVGVRRPAG
ncbi:glycosyltransferase [Halapricum sp. CBA1109]|uniref:glycosyltransferase family 4 protein n=1 Tax=Halapricum sp. CBA1109 TaxID=2668068 RepID=UPI0012F847C9|nr:glycosyltransferase family 4 protein [Halapricum sp. CBA1109]MUV88782.1 glycosyltransferase [Halapricum sp. CBA1109]